MRLRLLFAIFAIVFLGSFTQVRPVTPLLQVVQAQAPMGDPVAGKAMWDEQRQWCKRCHGELAQGGFGPDLAGRGLSVEQVKRAIRQPWAVMPAYVDTQVSDKQIADLTAWFASIPKPATLGEPRFRTSEIPNATLGVRLAVDAYGCSQCHEPEFSNPRRVLGGEAGIVNLDYFKKQVYEHTSLFPRGVMGNYSHDKVPESAVEELYKYVMLLGLRAPVTGQLAQPTPGTPTFQLTVNNTGDPKEGGLVAETITVFMVLAANTTATSSSPGFQGVKPDPIAKADAVQFTIPRLAPGDKQVLTFTLAGAGAGQGVQRGSSIRWVKPEGGRQRSTYYPQLPGGEYRDARIQDQPGDFVAVNPPARAAGQ